MKRSLAIAVLYAAAYYALDTIIELAITGQDLAHIIVPSGHELMMKCSGAVAFFVIGYLTANLREKSRANEELLASRERHISELTALAEAKSLSDEKFRTAFHTSPDSININTMDGTYVDINEGFTKITGFTREDVVGKTSIELGIWAVPEDRQRLVEGLRASGHVDNLETRFRYKDGTVAYGLISARVINIGGVAHILSVARDITSRVMSEKATAQSEAKLRLVLDTVSDSIVLARASDGRIVDLNRGFLVATGYTADECAGRTTADLNLWVNDEDRLKVRDALVAGKPVRDYEVALRVKDGSLRTGLMSASVLPIEGEPHILVTIKDITARKDAEERMADTLREKDALLREIHHRVKNNMTVISSLLSIEGMGMKDPSAQRSIDEIRGRVRAMALVHEKLYRQERLASINVGEYMRSLAASVKAASSYSYDVALLYDLEEEVRLDMDTLVPLGLILNELLTNAFKYAFHDRRSDPSITLALRRKGPERFRLAVSDNGTGLPSDFDTERGSGIGLRLVRMLVTQLSGAMETRGVEGGGACFEITFPVNTGQRGAP